MEGITLNDEWSCGQTEIEGKLALFMVRSSLPHQSDMDLFSHLMIVAWQFDESASGWLLTHDVQQQMDEFESCIFDACDNEKWWGAGVALVTLPGVREWQFYTPDPQLFMHEFCRVLSEKNLTLSNFAAPWTQNGKRCGNYSLQNSRFLQLRN